MKRSLSGILALCLLCLCLAGCGDDTSNKSKTMATYYSDNGYCVSYPEKYTPTSLGSEIDFVIMDEETGSNVTIQRTEKKSDVSDLNRAEFTSQMKKEGYSEVSISYFEKEIINDIPCLVAEFSCKENTVTKVFYDASDNTYTATLTLLPGIRSSTLSDFRNVVRGLMV